MSFPHPTPEEDEQLETSCPECKEPVDHWCVGTDGKTRSMLHTARRLRSETGLDPQLGKLRVQKLGDRSEGHGARAHDEQNPGAVLGPVCKECMHPAWAELRDPDRMAYACELHMFGTLAAMLIAYPTVAVSVINKKAGRSERRTMVEKAVRA